MENSPETENSLLKSVDEIESSLKLAYSTMDALTTAQKLIQSPSVDAKLKLLEERMNQLGNSVAELRINVQEIIENDSIEDQMDIEQNMLDNTGVAHEDDVVESEHDITDDPNAGIPDYLEHDRPRILIEMGPGAPVCAG